VTIKVFKPVDWWSGAKPNKNCGASFVVGFFNPTFYEGSFNSAGKSFPSR